MLSYYHHLSSVLCRPYASHIHFFFSQKVLKGLNPYLAEMFLTQVLFFLYSLSNATLVPIDEQIWLP
jgi:hypothetical protein